MHEQINRCFYLVKVESNIMFSEFEVAHSRMVKIKKQSHQSSARMIKSSSLFPSPSPYGHVKNRIWKRQISSSDVDKPLAHKVLSHFLETEREGWKHFPGFLTLQLSYGSSSTNRGDYITLEQISRWNNAYEKCSKCRMKQGLLQHCKLTLAISTKSKCKYKGKAM